MSDLSDVEREALATIECEFGARYTRLARRLARPGRFNRLRWDVHRQLLVDALVALMLGCATLSLISVVVMLTQFAG